MAFLLLLLAVLILAGLIWTLKVVFQRVRAGRWRQAILPAALYLAFLALVYCGLAAYILSL